MLSVETTDDFSEWDEFVRSNSESTFCHQSGWRDVFSHAFRVETINLAARDEDGALRGILPLSRVRGLLGHYLVSVPFVNDGGPLGREDARVALAEHAIAMARESGAGVLELRTRRAIDSRSLSISNRKIAVHLPLPDTVELLWSDTFKAKLRSQIRRPGKEGMRATIGRDQLATFYRVFSRNMRDLGTPVLPRRFFESLVTTFGERVQFFTVVAANGEAVAASCCLTWRDETEVTWASSLREYNKLSPNMLLYATMMEQAVRDGVRTFNFGRSSPDSPTHRFKEQWGGYTVPLPWGLWSRDGVNGTPSADSTKLKLAVSVWRRLPVSVANTIGPFLARQLP